MSKSGGSAPEATRLDRLGLYERETSVEIPLHELTVLIRSAKNHPHPDPEPEMGCATCLALRRVKVCMHRQGQLENWPLEDPDPWVGDYASGEFSETVRAALKFAAEKTAEIGMPLIATEALLLGLIDDVSSAAVEALTSQGVSIATLKAQIDEILVATGARVRIDELSFTPEMRAVAVRAVEIAHQHGSPMVHSDHMLCALFNNRRSAAFRALRKLGVTSVECKTR